MRLALVAATLALAAPAVSAAPELDPAAQRAAHLHERYTKYEYRVPMRDGVKLFTAVYAPKDHSKTYPFLIVRTPYSVGVRTPDGALRYGVDFYPPRLGPSEEFENAGYLFVFQDVRGRFQSEGVFREMTPGRAGDSGVDESTDFYDTVEWLLRNVKNNNGKAGIWGISYPGFYVSASIPDTHPAVKAASPQAPMTDLFFGDDAYHGGAFMLAANFGFYAVFTPQETPVAPREPFRGFDFKGEDGYEFFLAHRTLAEVEAALKPESRPYFHDQVTHSTYDDYWKARNMAPRLKGVRCATLTVGGWFDAEDLQGPFSTYHALRKQNPDAAARLAVGPWVHGGWGGFDGQKLGHVEFASKTAEQYRKEILFPFFEHYLRDAKTKPPPNVSAFETGANQWRHFDEWPPKGLQESRLYLRERGALSFEAPPAGDSFDGYVSDPDKPVPFVGYSTTGVPQEYMVSDQRFAATRADVLVYRTPPLEEDVTVAGPVAPRLFVSTSGTDADFIVKLIDVYPGDYPAEPRPPTPERREDVPPPRETMAGYQQLVRGEPLRGKFRKSFSAPEPFTPGQVEPIEFTMPDVLHTFRRGHRIMVQIQSSWFPLIDLNPQTFVDHALAKPEDFKRAEQRIYRGGAQASSIGLGILKD